MPILMRTIVALLVSLLTSCVSNFSATTKAACFDAAMAMPAAVAMPPVYHANAIPPDMPGWTCYASIRGVYSTDNADSQVLSLLREVLRRDLRPDVILFEPRGSHYAGSVSQHIGFGIMTSTPVHAFTADAHCLRLNRASLGITIDDHQMVTFASDDLRKECGIQEGDTLLSMNGKSVKPNGAGESPCSIDRLQLVPDSQVRFVWIRPGTGRMEGSATAKAPGPMSTAQSIVDPARLTATDESLDT